MRAAEMVSVGGVGAFVAGRTKGDAGGAFRCGFMDQPRGLFPSSRLPYILSRHYCVAD